MRGPKRRLSSKDMWRIAEAMGRLRRDRMTTALRALHGNPIRIEQIHRIARRSYR